MAGKGDPFEAQALMRRTEHISLVVIAVLYQGWGGNPASFHPRI